MAAAALGRDFFARPVLEVAPALLGCRVVRTSPEGRVVVRVTEVEAYAGEGDPGSHAARGRTPRTAVMFGPAAHLYVYFSYGVHWCVNVVTGQEGAASAVLLRGGEVVEGVDLARERRPAARVERDLARGPARLASALGVAGDLDGHDLVGGDPHVLPPATGDPARRVRTGPRVGVAGPGGDGEQYPWRLWLDGEPTVSVYRPGGVRRRRPTTS
ncbi:DNA-3-methyladenine glycosylase [uncultured Pseudokineococcus sp.]|uniref:DNA-3-methyladenine glycosylase n=1 Tax=uncultured Pseudokineococcus sp. TaxID=1642928 RepID=UPI002627D89A|nr:DNA-3-methyladenine glycosylase [uncultured Pseudokineococcus sp.]